MVHAELSAMGWEKDKHFSAVFLFPLPEKFGLLCDFQREVKVVTTLFFWHSFDCLGLTSKAIWRRFLRVMKQVGEKPNDIKNH